MFFYEGQTCPVCGRFFGEQDDIVTCPECGAPHHRACWKQEGHCHFENLHGTDQRWDDVPTEQTESRLKTCLRCGYRNPEFAEFCAHCGLELKSPEWSAPPVHERPPVNHYTPPFTPPFTPPMQVDPYGGVPQDAAIEGVPVKVIAEIVGPNTAYYLPRFMKMANEDSKVSWNWSAFLLESHWLLYRKNVWLGLIAFLVLTLISLFNQVFVMPQFLQACGVATMKELLLRPELYLDNQQAMLWYGILATVTFLTVAIHVLLALFGNYLYMRTVLRKARKRMQQPTLLPESSGLFTGGGVSFFLAILPQIALTTILNILNYILASL